MFAVTGTTHVPRTATPWGPIAIVVAGIVALSWVIPWLLAALPVIAWMVWRSRGVVAWDPVAVPGQLLAGPGVVLLNGRPVEVSPQTRMLDGFVVPAEVASEVCALAQAPSEAVPATAWEGWTVEPTHDAVVLRGRLWTVELGRRTLTASSRHRSGRRVVDLDTVQAARIDEGHVVLEVGRGRVWIGPLADAQAQSLLHGLGRQWFAQMRGRGDGPSDAMTALIGAAQTD